MKLWNNRYVDCIYIYDPLVPRFTCVSVSLCMCVFLLLTKLTPFSHHYYHQYHRYLTHSLAVQTISISKAGIQATLNARTPILAAANPVFGRYDRSKPLKANVSISAPIMSRFDLFFVIIDECNSEIDENIARHIIEKYRVGGGNMAARDADIPFTTEQLQRYIRFARSLNPKIPKESKDVLVDSYRHLRSNDLLGKNKTSYRITVRQLESLVRLNEALARLHLDEIVQTVYVKEAYRLLQKSIIFVESSLSN